MQIVEIKDIVRKELPIYYRRLYTGIAVMEIINKSIELEMEFQIEHKPTGQMDINLTLKDEVDYPVIPLHNKIKEFISDLDSNGKLPD